MQIDFGSVCVNVGVEAVTIVTGAQNLLVGDRIPVALVGATLPNELSIRKSKLRGVVSQGMLCSREELLLDATVGIERSAEGILVLLPEAPIGENFGKYLGREDSILDLELYPNRPDCLAMVNVAREVASLTREKTSFAKMGGTKSSAFPANGPRSYGLLSKMKNYAGVMRG